VSVKIVEKNTPLVFSLDQNYPNPFNPITRIAYELPKVEFVSLIIYDIMGREVVSLINKVQKKGENLHFETLQIIWDNQYQLECTSIRFRQVNS
tara:strand:+ start:214 stop:495 length:282 start_codon:yes stop_codon:yes gene_type:complete